ncbi:P-loop containing nucleoside triphosphate hydrolase [Pseudocohnilembus persalinus]|uniref:p-loop containing nucleoside triphosphate hydrolase n=1 Tax=Pseudocohnilembus persalinus TaxID=266149 RepID=A0A0V0QDG9_PSEPJ|nr:P-loop containing nucleoside triphosphate hydrolase [Pseudocohnilembus persalinus]|eukprot:KRX00260.1 P-loop containing nucleoside triphosphate hydrolase [Pseudocohnilembus persalinus]
MTQNQNDNNQKENLKNDNKQYENQNNNGVNAFEKLKSGQVKQAQLQKIINEARQELKQPVKSAVADKLKDGKYQMPENLKKTLNMKQNNSNSPNLQINQYYIDRENQDLNSEFQQNQFQDQIIKNENLSQQELDSDIEQNQMTIQEHLPKYEIYQDINQNLQQYQYEQEQNQNYQKMLIEEMKDAQIQQQEQEVEQIQLQQNQQINQEIKIEQQFQNEQIEQQNSDIQNVIQEENQNLNYNFDQNQISNQQNNLIQSIENDLGKPRNINILEKEQKIEEELNQQQNKFPKYLGEGTLSFSSLKNMKNEMKAGDELFLKCDKMTSLEKGGKKKGKKQIDNSQIPKKIRVLWNDREIGRLDNKYENILYYLILKNYIYIEATLVWAPPLIQVFTNMKINIKVYLLKEAISNPITKIIDDKDFLSRESQILKKFDLTKNCFNELFTNILDLKVKVPPLIVLNKRKNNNNQQEICSSNENSEKKNIDQQGINSKGKYDFSDPFKHRGGKQMTLQFQAKKNNVQDKMETEQAQTQTQEQQQQQQLQGSKIDNTNKNEQNNENQSQENESQINLKSIFSSDAVLKDDLSLSEPPSHLFKTKLHDYQKQALTWMLMREGMLHNVQQMVDREMRIIHPLWQEFEIYNEGKAESLYFNSYSGQVSTKLPRSSIQCYGGILADEMGLGKTVMMLSLIISNKKYGAVLHEDSKVNFFKKEGESNENSEQIQESDSSSNKQSEEEEEDEEIKQSEQQINDQKNNLEKQDYNKSKDKMEEENIQQQNGEKEDQVNFKIIQQNQNQKLEEDEKNLEKDQIFEEEKQSKQIQLKQEDDQKRQLYNDKLQNKQVQPLITPRRSKRNKQQLNYSEDVQEENKISEEDQNQKQNKSSEKDWNYNDQISCSDDELDSQLSDENFEIEGKIEKNKGNKLKNLKSKKAYSSKELNQKQQNLSQNQVKNFSKSERKPNNQNDLNNNINKNNNNCKNFTQGMLSKSMPVKLKNGKIQGKTLIVVPVTLLAQWEEEINNHVIKNQITFYSYYEKGKKNIDLSIFDIVLTTYGTISHQWYNNSDKEKLLYKYDWYRIVLDEAHYIKGRTIQTSKAIFALEGKNRWCLTGTPVQNKIDELFALVHFIKLEPWSDYIWWNNYINKPSEKGDPIFYEIVQTIIKPVTMRRTKQSKGKNGKFIIDLPKKHLQIKYITLGETERQIYDLLHKKSKKEFDGLLQQGVLLARYIQIFELLMRLRQMCDHPFLIQTRSDFCDLNAIENKIQKFIDKRHEIQNQNENNEIENEHSHFEVIMDENLQHEEKIDIKSRFQKPSQNLFNDVISKIKNKQYNNCDICFDEMEDPVITACLHVFCRLCMVRSQQIQGSCPQCRRFLTKEDYMTMPRESRFTVDLENDYQRSAKIEAIMEELQIIIEKKEKVIIFTQWLGMMDLLSKEFQMNKIKFERFDGSLNQQQRAKVLKRFKQQQDISVLMISLKAGGVGLNLTHANHCFIVDPWWNPAVESQAIERVHRIGQKKEVYVKRFICSNTIEERMIKLHEDKKFLFDNTINSANSHETKQRNLDNIKYLMENY